MGPLSTMRGGARNFAACTGQATMASPRFPRPGRGFSFSPTVQLPACKRLLGHRKRRKLGFGSPPPLARGRPTPLGILLGTF